MASFSKSTKTTFTLSNEAINDLRWICENHQNVSMKQVIDYICMQFEDFDAEEFNKAKTDPADYLDNDELFDTFVQHKRNENVSPEEIKKKYFEDILFNYSICVFGSPFSGKVIIDIDYKYYLSKEFADSSTKKAFTLSEKSLEILNKISKDLKMKRDAILDNGIRTYKKIANYEDNDLINEMKYLKSKVEECIDDDKLYDHVALIQDGSVIENSEDKRNAKVLLDDFLGAQNNLIEFLNREINDKNNKNL